MENKTEKTNWGSIIGSSILSVVVVSLVSFFITWLTLPNGKFTVGESIKGDTGYIITVNVKNYNKSKAIKDVEICVNGSVDIANFITDSSVIFDETKNVFEVGHISPNATTTIIIYSVDKINPDDVNIASDSIFEKQYLSNDKSITSTTIISLLTNVIIYGLMLLVLNYIMDKRQKKSNSRYDEVEAKFNSQDEEIEQTKQDLVKLEDNHQSKVASLNKRIHELRIYYLTRMRDYQKELGFWKDTIRKILYQSGKSTSDVKMITDSITQSLKTYGVNSTADDNIEEIKYLASKIAEDYKNTNP